MEHKKLLRRFQLRLLGFGLIRSLLWGVTLGCAAVFITAFVWHILLTKPAAVWLWGSFLAAFPLGFLPCFILCFPTRKRTAKQLDKTGLQERAGTMLEYRKKDGMMVQLQRADAAEHIRQADTKALRMTFPLKTVILCAVCAALALTMVLLPYDLFAPKVAESEESAREREVRALIDDLRQQVRDAQLSEEMEKELEALLDQLEKDLLASQSELEQAALIAQAQENIQETLFFSISRYAIGRALQQYTLTEGLGLQISGDHPTMLTEVMDELEKNTMSPTRQISRLANNLKHAAEESGIDPGDSLYMAVYNFGQMLEDMLTCVEGPDETPTWTRDDVTFIFDLAEAAMLQALEEQAHTEGEMENLGTSINSSLNSLLQQQGGEVMTTEGQSNQQQGGGKNSSTSSPEGGSDGTSSGTPVGGLFDSGDSNSTRTTMLEGIYDPVSGDVSYGDVFAAYYAQYLKALDAGEIPEELRPYFERYFSRLS